jgi:hypothetical protein
MGKGLREQGEESSSSLLACPTAATLTGQKCEVQA